MCSENKGADQLRGYHEADRGYREGDLRLCFRICRFWFSHAVAQSFAFTDTFNTITCLTSRNE